MKKQILTISVVIALMFLATMPTTSSYANETGKVWSDGYVELTWKMERTDTPPNSPWWFRGPTVGQDFVVINLTFTRIEGRYNVLPSFSDTSLDTLLFDDKGDNYTCGFIFGVIFIQNKTWRIAPAEEGSSWILYSEMPKNRKPVRLRSVYIFTESLLEYPFRENVSVNSGQIEMANRNRSFTNTHTNTNSNAYIFAKTNANSNSCSPHTNPNASTIADCNSNGNSNTGRKRDAGI